MKSNSPSHCAWIVLVALSLTVAYAADTELRIIELKHRTAEEVLPIVTPLMRPGTMIGGRAFQLFVRAPEREYRELVRLVTSLDTRKRNFKITVQQSTGTRTNEHVRRVEGRLKAKLGTRITVTGNTTNTTVDTGIDNSQAAIDYEVERRTRSRERGTTQVVRVLAGQRAFVRVGHAIPQVQPFLTLSHRYAQVAVGVVYQEVDTGFEVLPRMRGDQVEIQITPKLSFQHGHHLVEPVSFHQLSTTVIVDLGEWIDLGSAMSTSDEVTHAILARRARDHNSDYRVMMKVE